jgi:hypothetical protein
MNEIRRVCETETETGRNSGPIISTHTEEVLYIVAMERLWINHKYTHLDVLYIVVRISLL